MRVTTVLAIGLVFGFPSARLHVSDDSFVLYYTRVEEEAATRRRLPAALAACTDAITPAPPAFSMWRPARPGACT